MAFKRPRVGPQAALVGFVLALGATAQERPQESNSIENSQGALADDDGGIFWTHQSSSIAPMDQLALALAFCTVALFVGCTCVASRLSRTGDPLEPLRARWLGRPSMPVLAAVPAYELVGNPLARDVEQGLSDAADAFDDWAESALVVLAVDEGGALDAHSRGAADAFGWRGSTAAPETVFELPAARGSSWPSFEETHRPFDLTVTTPAGERTLRFHVVRSGARWLYVAAPPSPTATVRRLIDDDSPLTPRRAVKALSRAVDGVAIPGGSTRT